MRPALLLFIAATAMLATSPAMASGSYGPIVPAEQELDEQEHMEAGGVPKTDRRDHQKRAVGRFALKADRAAHWVKTRLSGFHVTPGRLGLGLGLLCLLVTWGKNKRVTRWAVLRACAVLLCLGSLGVIFFYEI